MTKNVVSYGFMSGFLIDTLILTKNLFIDRDINDIKDPKNDSPNSIFKNFYVGITMPKPNSRIMEKVY